MAESWLLRDGMDRERMLDMDERIRPLRLAALGVLALALLISTPWIGIETLAAAIAAILVAGVFFKLAGDRTVGAERPEYYLFAGWAASEVVIAACILMTGGASSPALAWLAIPVVTLSSRFSWRGVVAGVVVAELLLVAIVLTSGVAGVIESPLFVGATAAMIIALGILSSALMLSDLEHRTEAVIDPLTGLLNRAALRNRTNELAQRSQFSAEPVGVIVADIDHFKRVNDRYGHAVGDEVLRDIAYVLRRELRAFDLAYRIGGEEFVILLPGANLEEAEEFSRALHSSIGAEARGGQRVTMSFGVAASSYGDLFNYDAVFAAADSALMQAKQNGRNQVRVASGTSAAPSERSARHLNV